MKCRINKQGFTLIELLIVVAIIAILAAIAVPNFLEAQVRSKVSRVQADMRALATAMEAYRIDWNSVPPWASWADEPGGGNLRMLWLPGHLWWALTTPVPYMSSALHDAFIPRSMHPSGGSDAGSFLDPFLQVGTGYLGPADDRSPRTHWCAVSYGPDFEDCTTLLSRYPYSGTACPYDPTNGTVSRGDIYRHGDKPPTNFVSDRNMGNGTQGGFDPWW